MKRKKVSLLKLGVLLVTSSWFLWNCSLEEHHFEKEHPEFTNVETVSFKDAISYFKIKQEEILQKRALARNQENIFDVTPNWNSIQHEALFQIDQAQLTLADATINREGNYESKLFFLNINNTPEVVIFTLFPKEIDDDGKLLEASFFYNKLDGSFIDGFKIEEGKLSKRYLLKSTLNTQEAGFLMLFQGKEEDDDFWCDDGTGGVLDEVSLGTVSNSGGGISAGPTSSSTSVSLSYASVNWYYLGNGNSTGRHQLSGGGISATSGASSLYIQTKNNSEDEAYDPNKDPATGKCKYGYKMNPATGKCEEVNTDCTNGKVYNDTTKKCECPEGKVEDSNGNCVDDCNTSKEDLKKIFPSISDSNAELLAKVINEKGRDFGINTKEKLHHFLAQAGHETGGFNTLNVTESTYWTTASKLAKTYKKFTMDSTIAASKTNKYYAPDYLKNSSGVANVAMCCKYGNGNVDSGDGYNYRGRGIFQLTWKDNYKAFKTWYNNKYDPDIDPVSNPGIIASNDTLSILSGLWYYKTKVLDKIIVNSTTSVSKVTKPINQAKKGLKDRKKRFQKAKDSIKCL